MRARVTSEAGWQLPSGQMARPGQVLDSEACGIAPEQLTMLIGRGYLAPVEPEVEQWVPDKSTRKG